MNFDPNSLFYYMVKTYHEKKTEKNKIIFCNEGGSRSAKTYDAIHFITAFCSQNQDKPIPLRIGFFRNTLKDSREKLYYDFKTCLKIIGIFDSNNAFKENQSPEYYLYGNKIEFRGLDEDTEQVGYDIVFVNEALEVDTESKISGLKMRCSKLMIFDWNPKYTIHWIFEWEGRPDIYFTKTTYKNNKHLTQSIITEIESESPWHLDDLHLPKNERRPHIENLKNGTTNEWHFEVYGMGVRANKSGLVFPNVNWIESLPESYDVKYYGLDYGFTNDPTALTEIRVKKNAESEKIDVYCRLLIYEPTKDADILMKLINAIDPKIKEFQFCSDSADGGFMISDLRRNGYNIIAVSKPAGSILYGIDLMNRVNLHIVKNKNAIAEQENYSYMTVNGIAINEPVDKFNHMWDSIRYVFMTLIRRFILKN